MSDDSEKPTIVLTQDEFEKKLREDAVVENVPHLPKMPERLSLSDLVNLTAVWRLGDLVRVFPRFRTRTLTRAIRYSPTTAKAKGIVRRTSVAELARGSRFV